MPLPPVGELERDANNLLYELERATNDRDRFIYALRDGGMFLQDMMDQIGHGLRLGVPGPYGCEDHDENCILESFLGMGERMENMGLFRPFEEELSNLARKAGHNVPRGEIDHEIRNGEKEAEKFEEDVDIDVKWEEEKK